MLDFRRIWRRTSSRSGARWCGGTCVACGRVSAGSRSYGTWIGGGVWTRTVTCRGCIGWWRPWYW